MVIQETQPAVDADHKFRIFTVQNIQGKLLFQRPAADNHRLLTHLPQISSQIPKHFPKDLP